MLSHWKSKAADRALFSPSVSFLTHKRRTKTHSLCPHPAATVTAKHTLTHSHNPRESERERWGQKDRMRHIVTPQPSCGVGPAYVTRTHKKIKINKADRRKQEIKKKEKACIYLKLQQQMGGPLCSRRDVYLTSHPGSDEHHSRNGPRHCRKFQHFARKRERKKKV